MSEASDLHAANDSADYHNSKSQWVNRIFTVLLTIVLMMTAYVGWQYFKPYKITQVETPIVVKDKTIQEGEAVQLLITTCGYDYSRITMRVQLVTIDGTATPLFTLYDVPQQKGCVERRPYPIPLDRAQLPLNPKGNPAFTVDDKNFPIAEGRYKIRLKVTYKVNMFKTITKDYDSELFDYIVK